MPKSNDQDKIVVVGGSLGAISAICALLSELPQDFGLPLLIVMHVGPKENSLAKIFDRCGPLSVAPAEHGEPLTAGRVFLAPPNEHLLVCDGRVELSRGPRENLARPAINPLFRTAARSYREGTIGVLVSGELDDGVAGLHAIKVRGGVTIVQDPAEATATSMPRNALEKVRIDHCLPMKQIASLLTRLDRRKQRMTTKERKPDPCAAEPKFEGARGTAIRLSCPDCNGPLFEVKEKDGPAEYHCLVGHVFSAEVLSSAHADALERALWIAIRTLKEKLQLQQLMVKRNGELAAEILQRRTEEVSRIERDIKLIEEINNRL